jgi:hypothetical protein
MLSRAALSVAVCPASTLVGCGVGGVVGAAVAGCG